MTILTVKKKKKERKKRKAEASSFLGFLAKIKELRLCWCFLAFHHHARDKHKPFRNLSNAKGTLEHKNRKGREWGWRRRGRIGSMST